MNKKIFFVLVLTLFSSNAWCEQPAQGENAFPSSVQTPLSQEQVKQAREYYLSGQKYIAEGDYASANEALKHAQDILKSNQPVQLPPPQVSPVTRVPEESRQKAKKPRPSALETALENAGDNPASADAFYNLGVEFLKKKKFKEAETVFIKAIKLDPRDKDSYYNLGVIYETYLVNKAAAIKCYRQYLKLDPKSKDSWQVESWIRDLMSTLND